MIVAELLNCVFLTLFYILPMFNVQKHISSHFKDLIFKNILYRLFAKPCAISGHYSLKLCPKAKRRNVYCTFSYKVVMRTELILRVLWSYGMKDDIHDASVILPATAIKEYTTDGVVGIVPLSERNQHVIKTCGNFWVII